MVSPLLLGGQVSLKKVLRHTQGGSPGDAIPTYLFESYALSAGALDCLRDASEVNRCVVGAADGDDGGAATSESPGLKGSSGSRSAGVSGGIRGLAAMRPHRRNRRGTSRFRQRISQVIGVPIEEQPRDAVLGIPKVGYS